MNSYYYNNDNNNDNNNNNKNNNNNNKNKYWQGSMSISEDIKIKASTKQNYLEIYSKCENFQIKEKRHDLTRLI